MKKKLTISIAGVDHEVTLEQEGAEVHFTSAHRQGSTTIVDANPEELVLLIEGRRVTVPYVRQGNTIEFQHEGEVWSAELTPAGSRGGKKQKDHSLSAPMPGVVLKIFAGVGDVVSKGAPLLILEAMKMELGINAPYDGTVRAVNCKPGELVQPGVDLIELAPEEKK